MPLNKRTGINLNALTSGNADYAFIDHILSGGYGPVTGATNWFSSGQALFNSDVLDADGWPNTSAASGNTWGGSFAIPASTDYSTYVLEWTGQGEFQFNSGTWTVTGGSGYSQVSNGRWTGTDARIELTLSSLAQGALQWRILQSNQSGGGYIRNIRFFRAEDEDDLDAGYVYRRGWKQIYVDWNPSFIRFVNWGPGHNGARGMRFEHRAIPNAAAYGGAFYGGGNPNITLPYGQTSGTNQITVSSVTGTPTEMQHGEVVQTRITNTIARTMGSSSAEGGVIVAVTKGNPTRVEVTGHAFTNGDRVVFRVAAGMTQIDYRVGTVTEDDANHFYVDIDSTAYSNFTAGFVNQLITLNVGERGEYPVMFTNAQTPISLLGSNFLRGGDYKTFYFDKSIAGTKDSNGDWVLGAWLCPASPSDNWLNHQPGVPLEICTKLILELNEMATAQGLGPIHMWVTAPHMALLSMDEDYSSGSNYAIGMVDVCLNGANGYAGLSTLPSVLLIVENTNETWNPGFIQTGYYGRRGNLRAGASVSGTSYMSALRSVVMVQDIKSAFPNHAQIKYVLGIQGTAGLGSGNPNYNRTYGATDYFNDPLISPSTDTPISHHDYLAFAAYFLCTSSFHSTNAATMAATYASASTDEAREAACSDYIDGVVGSTSDAETVVYYRDLRLPEYADAMEAIGKKAVMYEGGWDRSVTAGTSEVNAFMVACKKSQAWSDAVYDFYKAFRSQDHAEFPAGYIMLDPRWGHAPTDTYADGVEGGGLDRAWNRIGRYNKNRKSLIATP